VSGQPVEPIPHGDAYVERDARQVIMMALPIASLPLRTAVCTENLNPGVVVMESA
jgi:hypothetical protein